MVALPPRIRVIAGRTLTVLACLLVVAALVVPDNLDLLGPAVFLRIPVEAVVGVALVLVLRRVARTIVAVLAGVLLGLLTIVKLVDMGFFVAFGRPFNLVFDWSFLGPALSLVGNEVVTVILLAVAVLALLALTTWAALRMTRLAVGHRRVSFKVVAVLAVIWIGCAVFGAQFRDGAPFASRATAALAYRDARAVGSDLHDKSAFAQQMSVDAFRGTSDDQLLTALRGKNVILTFVESYGRVAVQDSDIAPRIDAMLDAGTQTLKSAGFDSRSAFLTSSTTGGGSWLAHGTLESGLWVDNQQRYTTLTGSDRLTLSSAFKSAGWRTVNDQPSNMTDWPEGRFYGYDKLYDFRNSGYHGPSFSYASTPDQYTMKALQDAELSTPDHPPVWAEIDLVSSHWPWAPLPRMVDWNALGDGSVFDPMPAQGKQLADVWSSPANVRAAYADSIQYSLTTLISWLRNYGDDNTVLVFLGDHQPNTAVTGSDSVSRDVPITIVSKDHAVLDRIANWNWQPGLRPGPQAPVWPMDAFRDRFLTAYGPPARH
ncbi:MAG TPA: sulfatase-like hydrolase/transferase [Amycolatopsis sp.]|nr:sulfatase-like hydrolase/transferase [Amycolatopsis sp.]